MTNPARPLKSVIEKLTCGERVDLKFDDNDVLDLLEVLNFAYDTANIVLQEEQVKGSPGGAAKIKRYSQLSADLMLKVYATVDMLGAPSKDQRH